MDWRAFHDERPAAVPLPTYPFEHRRYWVSPPTGPAPTAPPPVADEPPRESTPHEERLLDLVRTHAAAVLGHDTPESVGPDDNFVEIGLSSFTALEVRNRLCEGTGLELSPLALFEHPTPAALAEHLRAVRAART
ncbi:acyl carrier protein [Micromonospora gifhornensis]|uniref:acyl carrier protein n=1 Tax=Micromonospora gifhornensis TaxID=84594 RepID=UPI003D7626A7